MDITFKTPEGGFNYRVCAVMVHEGRLLAMHDGRTPHYYLPGGRVKLHEGAEAALRRELSEELGIKADIKRPLWLNQGFFTLDGTDCRFHEICIYFLVEPDDGLLARGESFTCQEDGQTLRFDWLDFSQLEKEYFYPLFLKKKIFSLPEQFTLIENHD